MAINLALSEVSQKDPYWDRSAYNLLFGLIQLSFIIGKEIDSVSMNDVLQLRAALFPDDGKVNKEYVKIAKTDQIVYHSLLGTINAPEKTRNSILSTFDQKVSCFSYQEDLKEMMDSNSIDLNNIGNKKTAIFLILPDEKTTYHQLVSLFIKQSYEYLIYLAQQLEERCFPIRINYVLDEFSNLPAIRDFPAMISAARSRNIRFSLIVQSFQQLISRYMSDADTIKGNCTNLIFLNSRELNVLEEVSTLCGVQENNKKLFTVFGLQHLDKEKGQAVILSGRLFPFITELIDIDRFDNGIYEYLPIKKRLPEDKKEKSIIYYFEEKIKKIEQKESDLKQKELEEKGRKSNRKLKFRTCLCQYGSCFFSLIAIMLVMCSHTLPKEHWVNISVIPIGVSLGGIVLLYLIGILSLQTEIAEIILLGIPIVIEVLRIIFWKKVYILDNAFYMLLCYYIAIVLPYIDYYKAGWKLRKDYLILATFLNFLLLPFLSYFSFSQKTWYSDINGIIIFGMLVTMIIFYIFRLAKNMGRYKGEMEDILIGCIVIEEILYFLLTFTEFIILLVHSINLF